MRGVVGFAVLSVGLGFASYSFMPDVFDAADPRLSFASSSAIAATLDEVPDTGRLQHFSPGIDLKRSIMSVSEPTLARFPFEQEQARLSTFAGRFAEAQAEPSTAPAAAPSVELEPWRAAVLVAPSGLGPNGTQVSAQFLSPATRLQLVTALQGELKRVGCYAGEASGSWDRETRGAVATFMDRVNAVLPVDEPDLTLLELVKAHPRATCDTSCPEGQNFDGRGRCVPLAVLAQASKPRVTTAKSSPSQRTIAKVQVVAGKLDVASVATSAPKPLPFPAPMALGAGSLADRAGTRTSSTAVVVSSAGIEGDESLSGEPPRAPVTAQASTGKRKVQKVASQGRRTGTYRHVQTLFEHPLGRL